MLMEQNGIYADMYTKQAKNYLAISEIEHASEKLPKEDEKDSEIPEGGVLA